MKKQSALLWVCKRIRRRIPKIILLTLSSVANAIFSVWFALGTKDVINGAVSGDPDKFKKAVVVQLCIVLGILFTQILDRFLKERLVTELDRDWKHDLLHDLLHGDYAGVSAYHSGELLNRLNNDVATLDNTIVTLLPTCASMVARLTSAFSVLVAMEPMLCLVALGVGIVMVFLTGFVRRKLKNLNKRVSEENGRVSGFIQETLEKLLMVQAMDVSDEMEKRSDKLMKTRFDIQQKRKNVSLISSSCVSIFAYGASFCALVFCAGRILDGRMDYGTLMAVTQLINQVKAPMVNMSGIMPQYIAAVAAAERLMELVELIPEETAVQQDADALYEKMVSLDAKGLCFAYDRDRVFENAEFSLPKGQFGVILGHSGIGKSTLLKIMLGIFHPADGGLSIETGDGSVAVDRTTRKMFAYVPQGNLLISGTLRDNLILTRPDATEEQIQRAVHISAMDDYLPSLPKGLETVIGESAAGLSEGQAQRLSIARAVLSDAPIMLLDEATSALDAQTETVVLERLSSLPGKTCIAVTHRPAAIALSDWTMEMRDGKCIVEKTVK
ncbi:MAG: ABC transporter ATP-binding protein [Oscillospiraceae bacterium]|nr:ABC transporter ATP-binding protein [Oscillospiraceae bacterium]